MKLQSGNASPRLTISKFQVNTVSITILNCHHHHLHHHHCTTRNREWYRNLLVSDEFWLTKEGPVFNR